MDVLVTGSYGRCGTALIDHLHGTGGYEFTYLDRSDPDEDHEYGEYETVVADVADEEAVRDAMDGQDAVVHLAGYPRVESSFDDVLEPNVVGTYNVLEAARRAEVESVVFASSNHVVGGYEASFAPEIYEPEAGIVVDHTDPVRPDSFYGVSKRFGEDLGRFYVENCEYPERFYALRICSVRHSEYDHPYGDAESGVDDGEWSRDSDEYEEMVARMKAMWQSRRDFAHQVECCLHDRCVDYGVFYGVSDNRRRWFDLEHARATIGYDPQDDGEEWDAPPE
ncbi:NAD-dependent epimerase/dehydratase family protein [Natrarchaeobius chitinivorans]|uniref:NAD(P)-dependent oxidoreductase n=1 Tax=Natrarchaeobius chitinivorans TaxID=1679083 RepID=A0A3N6M060_NATCH|nr:NAD(P)-dependent oxidoreductase [Natrarchaeobius chitinivorans]RQG94927.1 NAD(P)-dependent oxidoreductase [Natrarchaeobius chitinivorans]